MFKFITVILLIKTNSVNSAPKNNLEWNCDRFTSVYGVFDLKFCEWQQKLTGEHRYEDCVNINGDVILDNDDVANQFQSFVEIESIAGNLVLKNTTVVAFSAPSLTAIGCRGNQEAVITIRDNPKLKVLRMRNLRNITMSFVQTHSILIENCPKLKLDVRQEAIFQSAAGSLSDMEIQFNKKTKFYRSVLNEFTPYAVFAILLFLVFVGHFVLQENDVYRLKVQENELLKNLTKMRNTILASELLIQTPCDETVSFNQPVLQKWKPNNKRRERIQQILTNKFTTLQKET